jgi:hypothetical protein
MLYSLHRILFGTLLPSEIFLVSKITRLKGILLNRENIRGGKQESIAKKQFE